MTRTDPVEPGVSGDVIWNPVARNWHLRAPWRGQLAPAGSSSARCPFCPGGAEALPSAGPQVVASKYPFIAPPADASYEPHRVLFISPEHERNLDALTEAELVAVLDRVRAECSVLLAQDAIRSVYAFQASGSLFGGSVSHPHLQVLGFPFVPTNLVADTSHGCPLCVDFGRDDCMISGTDDLVLAVPPWSRLPYEMVIAPRRHLGSMEDLDLTQIAILLSRALWAIAGLIPGGDTPYTLNFMTAPIDPASGPGRSLHPEHHLRIELFPFATEAGRVRQVVAIEAGAGVFLNPVLPANAASHLRRAMTRHVKGDRP